MPEKMQITFAEWDTSPGSITFESVNKTTGELKITVQILCPHPECDLVFPVIYKGIPPLDAYLMPNYDVKPTFKFPDICPHCQKILKLLMPAKSIKDWWRLSKLIQTSEYQEEQSEKDIEWCLKYDERKGQRKAESKGRNRKKADKQKRNYEIFSDENPDGKSA